MSSKETDGHNRKIKNSVPGMGYSPGLDAAGHWQLLLALGILAGMLVLQYGFGYVPDHPIDFIVYFLAWILAGHSVLRLAIRKALRFDFFNEFFLMSTATIGAFAIGAYSEGVAVMVFYSIGEWFQDAAVDRAKRSIRSLLDLRPDKVKVLRDGYISTVHPHDVAIGEVILINAGEKVALDGILLTDRASFDSAALTGESIPATVRKNEAVYAGMINLQTAAEIKVTAAYSDSKLSRILQLVQDATAQKSKTQLFIARFAKVYTPIVFALAFLVCVLPFFIIENYHFETWFYRSLVFLVISCPCALVVSIPLGYFGGIGLASRNGILIKGANFLDVIANVDIVVMDKTGTLTEGTFKVSQAVSLKYPEAEFIALLASLESRSAHPIARAIIEYAQERNAALYKAEGVEEFAGSGVRGSVNGNDVIAGNLKFMERCSIDLPPVDPSISGTIVYMAVNGIFAGSVIISDQIRTDSALTVKWLQQHNIPVVMLSGDRQEVVDDVASELGISNAFGGLLPEDKAAHVRKLIGGGKKVAFVGDGINDAPSLALADAGVAMGGLGSDAAIETADIVIQNDQPSRLITAIKAGRLTRQVVWQNIIFAMTVKVMVLILGAGGLAALWEAVIADVGVALLAILNAVRIQRKIL